MSINSSCDYDESFVIIEEKKFLRQKFREIAPQEHSTSVMKIFV